MADGSLISVIDSFRNWNFASISVAALYSKLLLLAIVRGLS